MKIQEILSYVAGKKASKNNYDSSSSNVGCDIRELMRKEDCDRCIAIFFDSYMGDTYTILPYDKLLNMTFGYNDDMDMVVKMLIDCARHKHQQLIKQRQIDDTRKKSANVMLYNADTKLLIGGIKVLDTGKHSFVSVISERERRFNKQDDVM